MQQPSSFLTITRALRRRCPVCGTKKISRHVMHCDHICPNCRLDLERQVGSFIGGIGLNTALSFTALVVMLTVGFIVTKGEPTIWNLLVPMVVVALVLPSWFYARSRLLWVAFELHFWPLEPGEVDIAA